MLRPFFYARSTAVERNLPLLKRPVLEQVPEPGFSLLCPCCYWGIREPPRAGVVN